MKSCFLKRLPVFLLLSFVSVGCYKLHFYEDPDDPGLSRFTSRAYNVTSAYINSQPWVSLFSGSLRGPYHAHVFRDSTSSAARDTLYISWQGEPGNEPVYSAHWIDWRYLIFSIPIKKDFSKSDFLSLNGKRFPADSTTVTVSLSPYEPLSPATSISGAGKIYFVKVSPGASDREFIISGLFEGNIGDSIHITKGRFDYRINPEDHNLR